MNRLDFIKRLVVATAAVAAIPVLSNVLSSVPSRSEEYRVTFKVTGGDGGGWDG